MEVISKAFAVCAALAFAACGGAEVPGTAGADATTPDASPPLDAFVEASVDAGDAHDAPVDAGRSTA